MPVACCSTPFHAKSRDASGKCPPTGRSSRHWGVRGTPAGRPSSSALMSEAEIERRLGVQRWGRVGGEAVGSGPTCNTAVPPPPPRPTSTVARQPQPPPSAVPKAAPSALETRGWISKLWRSERGSPSRRGGVHGARHGLVANFADAGPCDNLHFVPEEKVSMCIGGLSRVEGPRLPFPPPPPAR